MAPPRRCVFAAPSIASRPHAHLNFSFPDLPDFSKEITIIINEEQPDLVASFHVPEGLLTEKSEFFQAACRNEWKEATSRVIKLPDVEPDIFSLYLFWVHRGKLAVRNEWDPRDEDWYEHANLAQTRLIKLWILADRLADIKLRNATMDEMIAAVGRLSNEYSFDLFTPDMTNVVWSATTTGRPLRRLLLDYHISNVWVEDVEDNMEEFHPEFLKELMLAALNKVNYQDGVMSPFDRVAVEPCCYHDHNDKVMEGDCVQDE